MKKGNYNPYNREIGFLQKYLSCDDLIVSKTDTQGIIKYVNSTMLRITDAKMEDLIGQKHNIIRHPDMPKSIFKLMWDTIEGGEDFYGYVKNLSMDGSFYWTHAFITPDFNAKGTMSGYQSERRAPNPKAILEISCMYQELRQKEQIAGIEAAIEWFKREVLNNKPYASYIHKLQNQH